MIRILHKSLWAILPLSLLSISCELIGQEKQSNLKLTYGDLANKYIEFIPTIEQTQQVVNKWQYGFLENGEIIGCNNFEAYSATGYTPENNTITVYFLQGLWEKYTFTDHSGSAADGNLTAKFKGTYSPPFESEVSEGQVKMVSGFMLDGCPST